MKVPRLSPPGRGLSPAPLTRPAPATGRATEPAELVGGAAV